VKKRSIVVANHKTSISLEEPFWIGVNEIARSRGNTLSELISEIESRREHANLSSAIRMFVLEHFKARSTRVGVSWWLRSVDRSVHFSNLRSRLLFGVLAIPRSCGYHRTVAA
jgi:predicted DNA-binding ribbon-helix-helix protein